MTHHDCPDCRCGELDEFRWEKCEVCGKSYRYFLRRQNEHWSRACSEGCYRKRQRAEARAIEDATAARVAERTAAGQPICAARVGRRHCALPPLKGAAMCRVHASDEERDAAAYGKRLGRVAVTDDFADEIGARRGAYAPIVDGCRRDEIAKVEAERILEQASVEARAVRAQVGAPR